MDIVLFVSIYGFLDLIFHFGAFWRFAIESKIFQMERIGVQLFLLGHLQDVWLIFCQGSAHFYGEFIQVRELFCRIVGTVNSGAILTGVILSILVACDVYFPTPIASASLCLLVGGSACGALILTRHWSRDGLILSTALCGGLMVMAGLDYFCEEWRLMEFLWHQVLRLGMIQKSMMHIIEL